MANKQEKAAAAAAEEAAARGMRKNQKVTWTDATGSQGFGVVIADEDDTGHVPVAINAHPGMAHPLIWCAVTWLVPIEKFPGE